MLSPRDSASTMYLAKSCEKPLQHLPGLTIRRKCLLPPGDVALDPCSPVVVLVAAVEEPTEDNGSSSSLSLFCPYALQGAWSVGSRHVARLASDHAVG